MKLVEVKSSNIKAIGWENEVLRILFTNGRIYDYKNVPLMVFNRMLMEESKGSYFHRKINNKYVSKRMVEDEQTLLQNL